MFDGRLFSRSSFNYLRGLVLLKRAVPDLDVSTVLEIGGGFGTLGEIPGCNEGMR
ncbi:putative sugar O-methyltransferase [Pseudonocardia sp. MCCB 268]|nr:putative sugar O-methyltransferase [Pseudonocardia cytotoxica]